MTRVTLAVALLAAGMCGSAFAKEPLPRVSPEGLVLRESKDARIVYRREGVDFGKFTQITIVDPLVEFEKNWARDYNRRAAGLQYRISDNDMERIKKDLSSAFRWVLETELRKGGAGYDVIDDATPGSLILRPAILDLEVTAPDLLQANVRTFVRSAGAMTLHLELWDASSGQILARIIDRQSDDDGFVERATRGNNKAAATDILQDWARKLRSQLDAERGTVTAR